MNPTKFTQDSQPEEDQDYPINRSFFPERIWFRDAANRRPSCHHLPASPIGRDQEVDALRQEIMGWKTTASYWQGRCARAEMDNQAMHRLLNERRKSRTEAAPGVFRGVQDEHVGG